MTSAFAAALLDPARPAPERLTDPQGRPAGRRFDVYRNNVTVGLIEALAKGFPALRRALGADDFRQVARLFLRRHPPQSPVLFRYGHELPAFLGRLAPLQDRPWLADLARLDLALVDSYHAADAAPAAPETLAALSPDRLLAARVALAPSLRLLRSDWPLFDLWQGGAPSGKAQDVIVLRPEFDPEPHLLPPGGAVFVAALREGAVLGEAMAAAGPDHPLAATWTLLLTRGAVISLHEAPA
jgi:hypothetical protein